MAFAAVISESDRLVIFCFSFSSDVWIVLFVAWISSNRELLEPKSITLSRSVPVPSHGAIKFVSNLNPVELATFVDM